MEKIKILGAGLSGLSAAITLAKAGLTVDILEIHRDVGHRFHGDLQGLENWSEKGDILDEFRKMNIEVNFDCDPFSSLDITNGLKIKRFKFKTPLFYLVKRGPLPGTLDYGLKEQAITLGVAIHFGKTVPHNQANIVAAGPASRKIAGIDKGIVFETEMEDTAMILFNERAAFRGYAYLLVTNGYGCMCTVVMDDLSYISGCFEETKRIFSSLVDLKVNNPRKVGGVGSFSTESVFKEGGALVVGEAAGLQDFLWGFGMRYAITSGFLAARSVLLNEDYAEAAQRRFSHKLKASLVNRYLWEKFCKNRYSFMVDNSRFMRFFLYIMHNYNFLQRIIYPAALSYMRKKYPALRL